METKDMVIEMVLLMCCGDGIGLKMGSVIIEVKSFVMKLLASKYTLIT